MTDQVSATIQKRIDDNWQAVCDQVDAACCSAGRSREDVTIVGVTKYVDAAMTQALVRAGCHDLGENRPQVLWQKAEALADPSIRWHLIGHLQRNKSRRTVPLLHRLHSVDSLRLAQTVSENSAELGQSTSCLLEINVSGDQQKHGFDPTQIDQILPALIALPALKIVGLMGMASFDRPDHDPAVDFAALAALRDRLTATTGLPLPELSMGMSGDFEAAIAHGSTCVRIGSRLFEGVR
ncbi:Pyridoxal phosphate homeostasis protein [Rosistilla carotiformis]|uniref:Pyridoxal phosphate homeostasis protein n=1 Tax=Rosistilla carotiformis TaxID=2528017 RepID=A0A518JZC1_9BACT|nr:YggS family pyridoxal phosphate-dependent enzyme [Rosistilla carotiformis]QDV70815.1 Pyridoxal phosphate homeostasis protein [Rosistilla carotiformis]